MLLRRLLRAASFLHLPLSSLCFLFQIVNTSDFFFPGTLCWVAGHRSSPVAVFMYNLNEQQLQSQRPTNYSLTGPQHSQEKLLESHDDLGTYFLFLGFAEHARSRETQYRQPILRSSRAAHIVNRQQPFTLSRTIMSYYRGQKSEAIHSNKHLG